VSSELRKPQDPPFDYEQTREYSLERTVSDYASSNPLALQFLGLQFTNYLGDASSTESKEAWLTFLGLCENDPDVALFTVLSSARHLTRASLTRTDLTRTNLVSA
jgi:hypothetical protein